MGADVVRQLIRCRLENVRLPHGPYGGSWSSVRRWWLLCDGGAGTTTKQTAMSGLNAEMGAGFSFTPNVSTSGTSPMVANSRRHKPSRRSASPRPPSLAMIGPPLAQGGVSTARLLRCLTARGSSCIRRPHCLPSWWTRDLKGCRAGGGVNHDLRKNKANHDGCSSRRIADRNGGMHSGRRDARRIRGQVSSDGGTGVRASVGASESVRSSECRDALAGHTGPG